MAGFDLLLVPLLLYTLIFGWRRLVRPTDWLLLAVVAAGLKLFTGSVPGIAVDEPERFISALNSGPVR